MNQDSRDEDFEPPTGATRTVVAEGWDAAEKHAAHAGLWLKLDGGASVLINVCSPPTVSEKSFEAPDGETTLSTRFSVDVWIPGVGIRVWEMSAVTFNDVKRRRAKRADFGDSLYHLERHGTGMKTKYMLEFARALTPTELDERAAAQLAREARAAAQGN